jgi:hypothetical protein
MRATHRRTLLQLSLISFHQYFHARTNNNKLKSFSTSMKLGEKVDKKTIERAEKAEKDRAKQARKVQEKAVKDEKDKAEKTRKAQEKSDKTEKDRVEKATERERSRTFEDVLSEAGKSRGCCESCNYRVKNRNEYQPCKMGHEDSGMNKEFCADCSEPRYHQKTEL